MKIGRLLLGLLFIISVLSCLRIRGSHKKEMIVGLVAYDDTDMFISHMSDIIQQEAAGKVTILRYDSENDQDKQNEQVQTLLAQGAQALILNLVNRNSASTITEMARERRVPIIFINREPEESVINSWDEIYYVGSRSSDSGRMGVEILTDYFKKYPSFDLNGDGIIQYVVLLGEPAHQDTVLRTRAYTDTFAAMKPGKGNFGGEELMRDSAMWDHTIAKEKMAAMLAAFPGRIEAVLAINDEMALGAIDALKEAGYFGNGPFMPVVGNDGIPAAIDAIEEGVLLGTTLNNAVDQGIDALYIALALINKMNPSPDLSVPLSNASRTSNDGRYIWVPYQKITRENYRGFIKR